MSKFYELAREPLYKLWDCKEIYLGPGQGPDPLAVTAHISNTTQIHSHNNKSTFRKTPARPLYTCIDVDYIYIYIPLLRDNSWGALFSQGLSCGQKISPTANCPVGGVWHGLFEFFWKSHVTTWSRDQNLKVKYLENQRRYDLLQPLIWKVGWRGIYWAIWKISVTSLSRDSHVIKT